MEYRQVKKWNNILISKKKKSKIKKFIKFQIVALGGTVVNMFVIWLLKEHLHLHLMISAAIAIELAIIHNFTWHYFVTWKDGVKEYTFKNYLVTLFKYNVVTASLDYLVNLSVLWVLNQYLGVNYLIAHLIGMSCTPIFKFLANEFIIFPDKMKN